MDYRQESMVNIAFEILTKSAGAMSFYDIWKEVAEKKEFDEEQKEDNESLFYTNMILDGRMITVGENKWDLRTRHRFEEVHIDMNDIYNEDEYQKALAWIKEYCKEGWDKNPDFVKASDWPKWPK